MKIVATPNFFWKAMRLLSDDEYADLEDYLAARPDAGKRIPGGRGLRKLRWVSSGQGRGKRGGVRVVYFYQASPAEIFFVDIYLKSRKADLSKNELQRLIRAVEEGRP